MGGARPKGVVGQILCSDIAAYLSAPYKDKMYMEESGTFFRWSFFFSFLQQQEHKKQRTEQKLRGELSREEVSAVWHCMGWQ